MAQLRAALFLCFLVKVSALTSRVPQVSMSNNIIVRVGHQLPQPPDEQNYCRKSPLMTGTTRLIGMMSGRSPLRPRGVILSKATAAILLFTSSQFTVPSLAEAMPTSIALPTDQSPAVVNMRLSETDAFKSLRRERPVSRAVRELNDLKDLQDSRLDACADRGVFWEQCFMFGQNDEEGTRAKNGRNRNMENGLDYQLLSPMGALDPGPGRGKPPTW
eukprot:CAMPEP_0183314814 /NCGR_PEP_ID=MMETSP0160_2-20130417/49726_1 /TAXON_ID=2839 ORGANISM="Odontella Sinensis, Strain Grunow 1884" /NCGR_SAMPLE_ID=MMETSP0160_2 /ASSEMBLY_ACC=CAM_ASM_000250 /LENGTH=216 /DNA_ID=CAMNT_0025480225 /DNA_START=56 /DNA_END=706 /DNA_ORIENTATION=-